MGEYKQGKPKHSRRMTCRRKGKNAKIRKTEWGRKKMETYLKMCEAG